MRGLRTSVVLGLIFASCTGVAQARTAHHRPHHRYHHHHHHYSGHRGQHGLIAHINSRLARFVHPTHACAGSQEWLATYYWQGQRTATGARFNPHGHTAAHRTLPFGTVLAVHNPKNGRSVKVVVNDRGPFTHANIDLSLGAAHSLGMTQSAYVCVSVVGREYARR